LLTQFRGAEVGEEKMMGQGKVYPGKRRNFKKSEFGGKGPVFNREFGLNPKAQAPNPVITAVALAINLFIFRQELLWFAQRMTKLPLFHLQLWSRGPRSAGCWLLQARKTLSSGVPLPRTIN
jgi:hypothetical protein